MAPVPSFHDPLRPLLRCCLAATRSFTRIPVTGGFAQWADLQPELDRVSARHLPAVGLLVGMAACIVLALVSLPLPEGALTPLVAAVFCTIATCALTGALHEEGALRHAGALGLVLLLAAKLSLLALLGLHAPAGVLAALLAGHAVSRFWPLLVARSLPPLEPPADAPGAPLAHPVDRTGLAVAAAWCVVPLALMVLADGLPFLLLALLASGIALVFVRARLRVRRGGFTLASLGFVQQVTEAAFYLGAAFGVGR